MSDRASDATIPRLLAARKKLKQKKPVFIVHEAPQRKELPLKWRKPRGLHNKQRLNRKGHAKRPSLGFRSPTAVKGLHGEGMKPVLVQTLDFTVKEGEAIIIGRRVGKKKRAEIIRKAQSAGIRVLNAPPAPVQEAAP